MKPKHPRMHLRLAPSGKSVTIDFLPPSGVQGSMRLDRKDLTKFITFLGSARARMPAPHPPDPLEKARVETYIDPYWFVQPNPSKEGAVFTVDHPEHGPIRFLIPYHETKKLARTLINQLLDAGIDPEQIDDQR